jgi:hypothetical protein
VETIVWSRDTRLARVEIGQVDHTAPVTDDAGKAKRRRSRREFSKRPNGIAVRRGRDLRQERMMRRKTLSMDRATIIKLMIGNSLSIMSTTTTSSRNVSTRFVKALWQPECPNSTLRTPACDNWAGRVLFSPVAVYFKRMDGPIRGAIYGPKRQRTRTNAFIVPVPRPWL